MGKRNVRWRFCAIISLGVLCGCETVIVPPEPKDDARHRDADVPFFGSPQDVTMYDLESCARQLMADMRANAVFKGNYAEKKASKRNAKPTVLVDDIKIGYSVTNRVQERLDVLRDTVVRTELFNSDLFKMLSKHSELPPDYVVYGKFEDIPEVDGRHNYYLYIGVKDFNDASSIIWEGFRSNVKF